MCMKAADIGFSIEYICTSSFCFFLWLFNS